MFALPDILLLRIVKVYITDWFFLPPFYFLFYKEVAWLSQLIIQVNDFRYFVGVCDYLLHYPYLTFIHATVVGCLFYCFVVYIVV